MGVPNSGNGSGHRGNKPDSCNNYPSGRTKERQIVFLPRGETPPPQEGIATIISPFDAQCKY